MKLIFWTAAQRLVNSCDGTGQGHVNFLSGDLANLSSVGMRQPPPFSHVMLAIRVLLACWSQFTGTSE